jgi:acetylornithine deacetylase/succinyl-diaminopimelate desuccinylase-like protein
MIDESLLPRILERAIQIQQIAAPTFAEAQRAAFVLEGFQADGLADVTMDALGNVFARLPGTGSGKPLVISAHTDTVFPIGTDLTITRQGDKIYGPGIGDNSLGVASLFGLLWALHQGQALPADLWLVANVCEEGLGDLRGMKAVVDHFEGSVRAYLILEGLAFGHVYHRGLGVQRYRITCRTAGGHSWVNYGHPSAIHELARLVNQLHSMPIPHKPRSSLNVGVFKGGTSVNTIAAEAHLELDLRSEDEKILAEMAVRVGEMVQQACRSGVHAVDMTSELIGRRPAGGIPVNHPLLELAKRCLDGQGTKATIGIGSTDANVPLSRGLPAVTVGLTTGGGAHTNQEFINTAPLRQGLQQVVDLVRGAYLL